MSLSSQDSTPKQHVIAIVQGLPDDTTYEEILRELAFGRMIEAGLDDSQSGNTMAHDDVCSLVQSWQISVGPTPPSIG